MLNIRPIRRELKGVLTKLQAFLSGQSQELATVGSLCRMLGLPEGINCAAEFLILLLNRLQGECTREERAWFATVAVETEEVISDLTSGDMLSQQDIKNHFLSIPQSSLHHRSLSAAINSYVHGDAQEVAFKRGTFDKARKLERLLHVGELLIVRINRLISREVTRKGKRSWETEKDARPIEIEEIMRIEGQGLCFFSTHLFWL